MQTRLPYRPQEAGHYLLSALAEKKSWTPASPKTSISWVTEAHRADARSFKI